MPETLLGFPRESIFPLDAVLRKRQPPKAKSFDLSWSAVVPILATGSCWSSNSTYDSQTQSWVGKVCAHAGLGKAKTYQLWRVNHSHLPNPKVVNRSIQTRPPPISSNQSYHQKAQKSLCCENHWWHVALLEYTLSSVRSRTVCPDF